MGTQALGTRTLEGYLDTRALRHPGTWALKALEALCLADSIENSQINVNKSSYKQEIRQFLMKHCPRLIAKDVMRVKAFIEYLNYVNKRRFIKIKQKGESQP